MMRRNRASSTPVPIASQGGAMNNRDRYSPGNFYDMLKIKRRDLSRAHKRDRTITRSLEDVAAMNARLDALQSSGHTEPPTPRINEERNQEKTKRWPSRIAQGDELLKRLEKNERLKRIIDGLMSAMSGKRE